MRLVLRVVARNERSWRIIKYAYSYFKGYFSDYFLSRGPNSRPHCVVPALSGLLRKNKTLSADEELLHLLLLQRNKNVNTNIFDNR